MEIPNNAQLRDYEKIAVHPNFKALEHQTFEGTYHGPDSNTYKNCHLIEVSNDDDIIPFFDRLRKILPQVKDLLHQFKNKWVIDTTNHT